MNFLTLFKAVDALMVFAETAKRFKNGGQAAPQPQPPADTGLSPVAPAAGSGLTGQIEARLTNVVVAALKEAFDRDHARLELERQQLEEQSRRAEQALQVELRRQAADRELGRLRLLAGTALVGWLASVIMLGLRATTASGLAKGALAVGWVLLLGALGAAFTAQGRVGAAHADRSGSVVVTTPVGAAAVWLLVAGLAVTAISLLL